jgi:hypothetical protein
MNSYPEGSPFPHLWGNDTNIGFGVGDLLDFFGQGVVGDGVEQRIVVALEALALGLDQAHLRRFQAFLYQANEPTADVINRGDLLWCYDFVLEALLTLAPLVQRTSDGIREVIFPNVWP